MLDCPLDESFRELQLSDELKDALLRGEGPLGQSLDIARAYESFDWDRIGELAPGESTSFDITVTYESGPLDLWRFGSMTWRSDDRDA